jgi:hypothetical protein
MEPDARVFIRLAVKGAWDKQEAERRLSRYLRY